METFAFSNKTIVWKGICLDTMESCTVTRENKKITVNGVIAGLENSQPVNVCYQIKLDEAYEIESLQLTSYQGEVFEVRMVRENKKWFDGNGKHLEQFDDCNDIDIALTPFTNTIPINRLHLNSGESCKIDVIYIDPVKKSVSRNHQGYTHIESNKYRYENLDSGFVSNLVVDGDGFVIKYPGIWEMLIPEKEDSDSKTDKTRAADFASILVSDSRSADIDPAFDIYARLLGNWRLKMIDYNLNERTQRLHSGIWFFSRTLEGRAIQDVLVSPDFTERSNRATIDGNRFGNTFRMMDPKTHEWHVDWFNPVTGIHNELIARAEGDRIIQETAETDGVTMRWVFENITADSFYWHGEISTDKGKTWMLNTEFFAKKIND